ncbi:pentatricopeptide repeat-containing protein At3g26540-like [Chenopodium quinoa]|uniref:Pentatricopeptide repeat-containing protein n=1 Tax=Chenopodium quinoa TaxID=63459 RepID=A0A803L737_CHEQI|nr:pentatricopeptide repeat-containing protein At3g26540-like [Chenopodium quinoa]
MGVSSGASAIKNFLQINPIADKLKPTKAKSTINTILAHLEAGRLKKAVSLLFSSPFPFDLPLYGHLFQLCSANRAIVEARKVESHLISYYDPPPTFLLNRAIEAYGNCRCVQDARELFDEMPHRDGGSWNALITAYAKGGFPREALGLFLDMNRSGVSPSEVTFASVLGSCGVLLELGFARVVHGFVVKLGYGGNVILASALVDVYGKCDEIVDARRMFDEIDRPNAVSWNVIVRRYLEVGDERQSILMFFQTIQTGVRPLTFTYSSALVACSTRQAFLEGIQIHGIVIKYRHEDDEKVATSLIDMYVKCNDVVSARKIFDQPSVKDLLSWTSMVSGYAMAGRLKEAQELFDKMPERSIISWNAILAGYVRFGQWEEAQSFIFKMRQNINDADGVTLNLVLNVSTALSDIECGSQAHAYIYRHGFESVIYVNNALIDMYGKCGALGRARICFHNMSGQRDTISWNSLMNSLAQQQMSMDVITMFREMQKETTPNEYTFSTLLAACANIYANNQGKQIHGFMIRNGYKIDDVILSALLVMYSKCGHLEYALKVLKNAKPGDATLWNSMIIGCCRHGKAREALDLFNLMKEIGVEPDNVTFQAVFNACICEGFVDEGKRYFDTMINDYGITVKLEHYECMINLYTRYGAMKELVKLLKMPFKPTMSMLTRIFDACKVYSNPRLAMWVAKKLN